MAGKKWTSSLRQRRNQTLTSSRLSLKFAFAALLAFCFFAVQPSSVSAKTKKANYGTIKILTNPGGLLLTIDGKPRGEIFTEYRAIDLEPGTHNVQVTLPNGRFWIRDIELPAGRVKCV